MSSRPQLSVVVPAYNEESRLEPTLREIVGYFREVLPDFELLVVDDGSSDGTARLVERLRGEWSELTLIQLARNSGKGCAVRTGIAHSTGRYVLFLDADGATPIREFAKLEAALQRGAHIAIGSRALHGEGVLVETKMYRKVMGRVFHSAVRLLTVRGLHDTQCGFKMFRGDVARDLFRHSLLPGFAFDVEVLFLARSRGFSVAEIPISWTHQPGSRINLLGDSLGMLLDLVRIRVRALAGRYEPRVEAVTESAEIG